MGQKRGPKRGKAQAAPAATAAHATAPSTYPGAPLYSPFDSDASDPLRSRVGMSSGLSGFDTMPPFTAEYVPNTHT